MTRTLKEQLETQKICEEHLLENFTEVSAVKCKSISLCLFTHAFNLGIMCGYMQREAELLKQGGVLNDEGEVSVYHTAVFHFIL